MSFQQFKRTLAVGGHVAWMLVASHSVYAEHIDVYPSGDGSSFSIALRDLTDITFEGKNIVFNLSSGDSRAIPMADLSELRFSQNGLSGIKSAGEGDISLSVYPNPTADILYLNLPESADEKDRTAAIYSVSGKLMWQTERLMSNSINVSNLPSGMYVLTINNLNVKFIKK